METARTQSIATFRYEDDSTNGHVNQPVPSSATQVPDTLLRSIGFFSLGLGLAQLFAPQRVANLIGLEDGGNGMRLIGLREIAAGAGILIKSNHPAWFWLRIGGDIMDLAILNAANDGRAARPERIALAKAAVAGIAALDALAASKSDGREEQPVPGSTSVGDAPVKAAVTVNAPIDQVYAYWEDLRNLPRFMSALANVRPNPDGGMKWIMSGPAGIEVAFDTEIVDATRNERIAWRAMERAPIAASGEVLFRPAPGDRGTQVITNTRFSPPGGPLGAQIAGLLGPALSMKMQSDLLRMKQIIELGEIVLSDDSLQPGPNPAQPIAMEPAA
ncbi:MAG: SRPBCC family protein [Thermomicrobiales bacterium]